MVMKKNKVPREWVTIHFKEYPRLDSIKLHRNFSVSKMNLETLIEKRESRRKFNGNLLSLKELSKLLYYSCGITRSNSNLNMTRRAYPSAGARYPLEVYIVILKKDKIKTGLYHYNVKYHSLELLLEDDKKYTKYFFGKNKEIIKDASALVIITSIPSRMEIKYLAQSDKFILLEAGHVFQNTYLISEAMGLGCCAIGRLDDDGMNKLLDIDGKYENIIYIIAIGKIS